MRITRVRFIVLVVSLLLLVLAIAACQDSNGTQQPTTPTTQTPGTQTPQSFNVIIPEAPTVVPAGPVVKATCTPCHPDMADRINSNIHSVHDCAQCHTPGDHPTNPLNIKPVTNLTHQLCGGCHVDQYQSFLTVNLESKAKEEKGTFEGVSPRLEKLLAGHGFTKQHDEPRSHAFMVLDHITVDRAYGGRFQLESWQDILATGKAWDILVDMGLDYTLPESAKAANPVCLSCKSTDQILNWAYLGEPSNRVDWDRTSNVADYVQTINNPMGCIMCHDPHTTSPRIVQDGLIEAIGATGPFPYMNNYGNDIVSLDVINFRDFRSVALLDNPVSTVMCGQCHVEYICNPGIDTSTGEMITMLDPRTNHFPWVNVFDIYDHYNEIQFRDFRHAITGATLVKLQHPDVETFWGSSHQLGGAECSSCHMPRMTNEQGETYTSHWQTSPLSYTEHSCLSCHDDWTVEQAEYKVEAIQSYIHGKRTKAEYWLERLIDTFEIAIRAGVSESTLDQARIEHQQAHILWEWWTAGNSGGFHNPDFARESLTRSVEHSKKGIDILENALK